MSLQIPYVDLSSTIQIVIFVSHNVISTSERENFLQKYCKSMEGKLHQPLILLLFLLFFSSYSYQLPSSAYTLPDKYFINCGSNINLNIASRTYVGDMNSGLVSFTKQQSFAIDNDQASKTPSALYRTARIFRQMSSYVLEIDSNGSYLVRLHFFSPMNLSAAAFDVSASAFLLLHNFTVQNSKNTAVIKEFILSIPIGRFSINFVPRRFSFAFVNAIEVFPAPPDFIDEANNGNKGILSQALHTIHRINVGGPTLSPENDTLLRTWLPDDGYLYDAHTAKNRQVLAAQPNYLAPVNKFIAPAPVYMTAKEMIIDPSIQSNNFNVTWSYDVTRNARHLVRVHFCDIVSSSLSNFQFLLYIDCSLSQKINPYQRTGRWATPFYFDFVVDSDDSGLMNISIGPDSSSSVQTPFLNGIEIMEMVGVSDFVTVKSKQKSVFVIVGLVLGGLVLVCVFGGLLCNRLKCRKSKSVETPEWPPLTAYKGSTHSNRKMPQQSKLSREGNINTSPVPDLNLGLKIPFFEIQLATGNFDTKLLFGKGGFGDVYRGTLRTGIKVAVKRSKPGSGQGLLEFQTEIMVLSRIRHLHLVSLIGYCDEMSEMILVYEFMEKGTLREHLYNSELPSLPWKQRLEICIGAARGLNYLHKVVDPTLPRDQVNLAEWGMLCKKKGLLEQILDPSIKPQINPNSLRKFADIAEKCLQEEAIDRPTMSDVAWELEYALQLQQTAVAQEPHEDSMSNIPPCYCCPLSRVFLQ
ncbi:hypothetical protein GQ457_02G008100 [Hibiscus cannabinus]